MAKAVVTAMIMMTREVRVPCRTREKTSLPMSSVPMKCQKLCQSVVIPRKSTLTFPTGPTSEAWVIRTYAFSRVRSHACHAVSAVRSTWTNWPTS